MRAYWWPQMAKQVKKYVETCDVCQRMKAPRHKPHGELAQLPLPKGPWQEIAMDFIVGLPPAKHRRVVCDAILVVVCRYSKMVRFIPCTGDVAATELATILCEEVFARYGTPKSIVTDRGPVFTSNYWGTLCSHLAVRRLLSTAFHPQTDGQTERTNQTLECYLRCYANWEQDNWPALLASAEYACNNAASATTGQSPFQVVLTFEPTIGQNVEKPLLPSNAEAEERAARLRGIQEELEAHWRQASRSVAAFYDKYRKPKHFEEGSKVLLSSRNISLARPSPKLADKLLGPFKIEKRVGKNAYRLRLPAKYGRIHPTFHVSLLEEYRMRDGCVTPEPVDIEGDEEWEVEQVMDARTKAGEQHFLVRWKGFSEAEDTWEPRENLAHASEKLREFEEKRGLSEDVRGRRAKRGRKESVRRGKRT